MRVNRKILHNEFIKIASIFIMSLLISGCVKKLTNVNKEYMSRVKAKALLVGIKQTKLTGFDNNATAGVNKDIKDMTSILKDRGFKDSQITSRRDAINMTRADILKNLENIAQEFVAGDIFVFYFSGHGYRLKDSNYYENEEDKIDDALVAHDSLIVDNEINKALKQFNKGVRIVMIIDACHSGSMYKMIDSVEGLDNIELAKKASAQIDANLIYFGATSDRRTTSGDSDGSYFTQNLYDCFYQNITSDYRTFSEYLEGYIHSYREPTFYANESAKQSFIHQLFLEK